MVVGSDILPKIQVPDLKNDIGGSLIAQNTIFGWILCGPVARPITSFSIQLIETMADLLGNLLKKFWEQEEVPEAQTQTDEDTICEDRYRNATYRRNDGRYVVKLPFKPEFPNSMALGHSRLLAQQIYAEVLEEYQALNHMERMNSQEIIRDGKYFSNYLPHHAVIKPDSKSTKVRVVFNASKLSHSGLYLNNILHTGLIPQNDLMLVIIRWRLYKYVSNGDIEKNCRQIYVHKEDQDFQRILFRKSQNSPVEDYKLKRVTFEYSTSASAVYAAAHIPYDTVVVSWRGRPTRGMSPQKHIAPPEHATPQTVAVDAD
ncbi:uncharacterized protein LOC101458690 [Ceratitis capitata]|uniref:uncharacterized protein LOC101458690 n=1 Tax=Ceratitis capitata TaxID=7213 RepID=UPI00032A04A6|nr:uncharacterized protein LOC101458690 [Ceratitis capitata]